MRSVEETRPRPGSRCPSSRVLDEAGDAGRGRPARARALRDPGRLRRRRRLRRGHHRRVGPRCDNAVRQRVIQVCAEEVAKANARAGREPGRARRDVGRASPRRRARDAREPRLRDRAGADAAVLAPLSIRGIDDPVRFVARDVADLLDARARRIPVYLYDNADIAVDPQRPAHPHAPGEGALAPRLRARHQGLGAAPRARQLHAGGGELPRARRVRDLRRQRDADLRAVPPAQRLARRDRRALEPLPAARRAPDRRGRRPGERAAARVGARLAGVPRGRRRAHGAGARGARGVPRGDAAAGREAHHRVSQARAARARRDPQRGGGAGHAGARADAAERFDAPSRRCAPDPARRSASRGSRCRRERSALA